MKRIPTGLFNIVYVMLINELIYTFYSRMRVQDLANKVDEATFRSHILPQ